MNRQTDLFYLVLLWLFQCSPCIDLIRVSLLSRGDRPRPNHNKKTKCESFAFVCGGGSGGGVTLYLTMTMTMTMTIFYCHTTYIEVTRHANISIHRKRSPFQIQCGKKIYVASGARSLGLCAPIYVIQGRCQVVLGKKKERKREWK